VAALKRVVVLTKRYRFNAVLRGEQVLLEENVAVDGPRLGEQLNLFGLAQAPKAEVSLETKNRRDYIMKK
jgi:hypothetical protein